MAPWPKEHCWSGAPSKTGACSTTQAYWQHSGALQCLHAAAAALLFVDHDQADRWLGCRPGASEAALDEVQQRLGQPLPLALRALYRIHDGQTYNASTPPLHGLFGW